jgi:hypothetical protein
MPYQIPDVSRYSRRAPMGNTNQMTLDDLLATMQANQGNQVASGNLWDSGVNLLGVDTPPPLEERPAPPVPMDDPFSHFPYKAPPDWLSQVGLGKAKKNLAGSIAPNPVAESNGMDDWAKTQLAMLTDLAGQTGQGMDVAGMLGDITGGMNKAYGAQIGGIKHQMQGARADTKEGKRNIQAIYRQLSKSQQKGAAREAEAGQKQSEAIRAGAAQSAAQTRESANDILNQNAAAEKAYGIEGVGAALNAPVNEQTERNAQRLINQGAGTATQQQAESGIRRRFLEGSANASMVEGSNRSADLFAQLQDYLTGSRDKIADLLGQKASQLAAAKNDIIAKASQQSSDAAQQKFANMMGVSQFGFDIAKQKEASEQFQKQMAAELAKGQGGGADFADLFNTGYGKNLELAGQVPKGVQRKYEQFRNTPEVASQGYFEGADRQNIPLDNEAGISQYVEQNWPNMPPQNRDMLIGMILNMGLKSRMPEY